jgi:hypothetical protein
VFLGLLASQLFWSEFEDLPISKRIIALLLLPVLIGCNINLFLVLALKSIAFSFLLGGVICLFGLIYLIVHGKGNLSRIFMSGRGELSASTVITIGVGTALLVWLVFELFYNLFPDWDAWDARSIWFFQGKMIYFDGGFNKTTWTTPEIRFSHVEYPKLIPILASQVATLTGYWNEYEPPTAIAILLVIECLLLIYVANRASELIVAIGLFALLLNAHPLVNGYMDAHVAVLSPLALSCLGRWIDQRKLLDFSIGALTLGILGNLKQEGLALAVIISIVIFSSILPNFSSFFLNRNWRRLLLPISIALVPILIWHLYKEAWGLKSWVFAPGQLTRASARLNWKSISEIFNAFNIMPSIVLYLAVSRFFAFTGRSWEPRAELFAITAAFYLCVLFVIYFIQPFDLKFQIAYAADRNGFVVNTLLITSIVMFYRSWVERRP